MSTFDADFSAMVETRQQQRLMRKLQELELDMADVLAGPTAVEIEAAGPVDLPPEPVSDWWRAQFVRNWPEGKRRRRWVPWKARR